MDEHEHRWRYQVYAGLWTCDCGARGYGHMGGPPAKPEPTLLAAFVAGLKAHLRKPDAEGGLTDDGELAYGVSVTWETLDAAIDAFAAEFQRGTKWLKWLY